MKEWRGVIVLAAIMVAGFVGLGIMARHELGARRAGPAPEDLRKLGSTLESKALWADAADAYARYLDRASLSEAERATVNYHLGAIYLDHLFQPDHALPYLITARMLAGDAGVGPDADKRIVEALEKMGRSLDAQSYLSEAAALDQSQIKKGDNDMVIAKVGEREITMRELEEEIQALPPEMQQQLKSPEKKAAFLQNVIAKRLLLDGANREGLNNDPKIKEIAARATEAAIIGIYQDREIDQKIRITDADVRAYYEAHKDEFVKKDEAGKERKLSYEEAKDEARAKLLEERRRALLDELLNRLQQSEKVEIYSDRLGAK